MEDKFIEVLGNLVQINSINPTLAAGPGEEEIANFVVNYLEKLGLQAELQLVAARRYNVAAVIQGQIHENSLLLNAHLDTVGVEEMEAPFTLKREGNKLFGRGAYDMKGSVAIMLFLAEHFAQNKPPNDLLLTFVADEEDKSIGMEYITDKWLPGLTAPPVAGIFLEPTELQIGVRHKGFVWFEVEVQGKAAHGSRPEEGIDAILPLHAALEELGKIQSELSAEEGDPLLGRGSLHTGVIEGGSALSVIPASAKLNWERRTLPSESKRQISSELDRVIQAVKNVSGEHKVSGRELFNRPAHAVSTEADIAKKLQSAAPDSKIVGCSFWADSAIGGLAGFPSVLFGPVGHGAHAVDEWVSLASLVRVYEVVKRVVEESL